MLVLVGLGLLRQFSAIFAGRFLYPFDRVVTLLS
jgi:hypothetical protein